MGIFVMAETSFPHHKTLRKDAHGREENFVAHAAAPGARVSQVKLFVQKGE